MRRLATWCLLAGLLVALPVIARAATTVMDGNAPSPPVVWCAHAWGCKLTLRLLSKSLRSS